ncbi:Zinc finger protein AEBP2 [Acipenser ruthenus]|uniref:Zinc finger protein AEBP2 n=1 Tax=Acipenser ruthenus TaxID=7906 RepID=A0A444V4J5_ACIRT|nr:Zinc finger protein AEBP2 [Acipenser ruthenus]
MAATSSDSAEQDSPSSSNENGAPPLGETEDELRGLQLQELKQSNEEKMEAGGEGNGEREVRGDGDGKAAAAEEEDEEEEIGSVSAGGEEETSEQQSPASSSETGDGPEKEIKQEQREECESVSGDGNEKSKAAEDTIDKSSTTGGLTSEHANKRRASVEISSSDGEPLSRMDSEDRLICAACQVTGQRISHIISWLIYSVFVCLWKGCKVYNTPSTSQSWLQRHMLTHSGDKPFKCVVGGCNASFASQGGLARHVPTHFSQQNSSKVSSQPKVKEESPSKACLNKRKRLKNKRRRSLRNSKKKGRLWKGENPAALDTRGHRVFVVSPQNIATEEAEAESTYMSLLRSVRRVNCRSMTFAMYIIM